MEYKPIRDNDPYNSKIIGWDAIENGEVIDSDPFLSNLKKRCEELKTNKED